MWRGTCFALSPSREAAAVASSCCAAAEGSFHQQRRHLWGDAPASVKTAASLLNPSTYKSDSSRRPPRITSASAPLRVFQCICAWPHRHGVSRTALSCVHAQRRFYATTTTADGDSASPLATSAEEFEKVFFDYPVAERLAALIVAKHEVGHGTGSTAATGTSTTSASWLYMPMKDFVKRMSPLTRDDMLRRHLDVLEWITESKLLQLVNESGETIELESLRAHPTVAGPATQSDAAHPPLYNGFVHVRTTIPAAWLLQAGGGADRVSEMKRPCSQLTHWTPPDSVLAGAASTVTEPPCTLDESDDGKDGAAALSTAEREEIIKEAFLRSLRNWDTSMQQHREGAVTRAPSATSGCTPNLPRYTYLTTVYKAILREAAGTTSARGEDTEVEVASDPLTPTARYILKRLRMSNLESIVDNIGVVVTVGNTASARAQAPDGYPAISSRPIWVVRGTSRNPVTFVALRYSTDTSPPRFRYVQPCTIAATRANNFGGWGSESVVPTKADVYEILKYVPVNWGSIGNLNLPPEVKRRHIRASSTLMWFRRQPFYFEVRDMNGTVELRRSIVLHPEAHGMTKEEAWEVLELQLATGEANSLVPLGADGAPLRPAERAFDRSITKFVYRVCPTYFAPLSLTMQRYGKKNLTEPMLMAFVRRFPQDFEVLTSRYSDTPLVRRRAGADSARWMSDFVADLERYPEDVRAILILCNVMCVAWDRPEYVYVRLSQTEQEVLGGYSGMQTILSRHPAIFRVGRHFVCRTDPSNPLAQREAEPAVDDVTSLSPLHQENPYHSPKELVLVFHYVMPEDEPCTAAYLVDCSSPAMRAVLPPRLVTIVQLFPKMFACTETSPGVYCIRKLKQPVRRAAHGTASVARSPHSTGDKAPAVEGSRGSMDNDAIQMLEDELADEDHMTREEVVQTVRMLIPESGVEAPQLLLWASMSVQRAASEYYGGVLRLVEAHPGQFRVVTNEHTKRIYKK